MSIQFSQIDLATPDRLERVLRLFDSALGSIQVAIASLSTGTSTKASVRATTPASPPAPATTVPLIIPAAGTQVVQTPSQVLIQSSGITSITGTAHEVITSAATGDVTLSTPQPIDLTSTPQFARLGLGAAADASVLLTVTTTTALAQQFNGATTGAQYLQFQNTSGQTILGVESSAGGALFTNSSAYSTVIGALASKSLHLGTNGIVRLTVDNSGNVFVGTDPGGSDLVRINGALTISSAALIQTKTSFTNNAAAQTATLTNSPTAGNPTKWIPINDNGTTRNIPAW